MDISKDGSKIKVLLIPTNEELMIARDTKIKNKWQMNLPFITNLRTSGKYFLDKM